MRSRDLILARATTLAMVLAGTVSCSGDGPSAPKEKFDPPGTIKPVVIAGYVITPDQQILRLGDQFTLRLVKVMSDGSRIPVATRLDAPNDPTAPVVHWIASNPALIALGAFTGQAVAVGSGEVVVQARLNDVAVASTSFTISPASDASSGALVINDFWVIEFTYPPPSAGDWNYAPQFRVSAKAGRTVTVLRLEVSIPGLGKAPPFSCGAQVGAASRDLNGELYGDYSFSMGESGKRATGAATAIVTFVDDAGVTGTVTVQGEIVQGTLPVYGTFKPGACYHGYGSGG